MVTDTVADLLTRIRNAQRARHRSAKVPASKIAQHVLEVLKNEGFIDSFEVGKDSEDKFEEIVVTLKYYGDGEPAIEEAKRVSRPGRRVYARVADLPRVHCGLGLSIISTSRGILSDREARKQKVGGEVLARIS